MKKSQETLQVVDTIKGATMYIAFELSNGKWKLAFSDGSKVLTHKLHFDILDF